MWGSCNKQKKPPNKPGKIEYRLLRAMICPNASVTVCVRSWGGQEGEVVDTHRRRQQPRLRLNWNFDGAILMKKRTATNGGRELAILKRNGLNWASPHGQKNRA